VIKFAGNGNALKLQFSAEWQCDNPLLTASTALFFYNSLK